VEKVSNIPGAVAKMNTGGPLLQRRGKQGFKKTVRKCLARNVLTTDCIWKFSKQVKVIYMCILQALGGQ